MRKFFIYSAALATLLTILCSNSSLFAQEQNAINLNQVVVTGTGTHHKLQNSPVPVEVINSKDLVKTGATDFVTAMTMLNPSLSFSPTAAMGSYLTMNGLGNKYIVILVDGKRIAGDVAGNIDISRINMNNIKRIEVLKGAASALYGSDAIAGVINIITNNPKDNILISTNTKIEGYGQITQTANASFNTKGFASHTSYMYQQADNWKLSEVDETGYATASVASAGFGTHVVSQNFTFNPTEKFSLYANGQYYNKLTTRPKDGYDYDIASLDYSFSAGARYSLKQGSYINLDLVNDNYQTEYEYINPTTSNNITYEIGDRRLSKKQHFYNANLRSVLKHSEQFKTTIGYDFLMDKLNNPDAEVINKTVYTMGLYGQEEIELGGFQAVLGVRYVYHQTFKNKVTPKASIMYKLNKFNFRASYSAGFRAPRLEDLYYNKLKSTTISIGNPNLKPESSNYYSVNAEYASNNITFGITGYINNVDDMISDYKREATAQEKQAAIDKYGDKAGKKVKYVKEYENLDKAQIKGIELNLTSYLGAGFSINGGYNYAYAMGKTGESTIWRPITRSIRHTGTVVANWDKRWDIHSLNLNINGRLQSKRYHQSTDSSGNIIDESAPGYGLWNFNALYTFEGCKRFTFQPGFGINNIFDKVDDRPYGSNYANLSPGRTIYFSLLIKFKN